MSMRERLAKILSDADGMHPDAVSNDDDEFPVWTTYLGTVDAVLDALMEPTEGMFNAAEREEYAGESCGDDANIPVDYYLAEIVWSAMIQAAKEGK